MYIIIKKSLNVSAGTISYNYEGLQIIQFRWPRQTRILQQFVGVDSSIQTQFPFAISNNFVTPVRTHINLSIIKEPILCHTRYVLFWLRLLKFEIEVNTLRYVQQIWISDMHASHISTFETRHGTLFGTWYPLPYCNWLCYHVLLILLFFHAMTAFSQLPVAAKPKKSELLDRSPDT